MGVKIRQYHGGYANLAAAIVDDGEKHNDKEFLESEWCELLRDLCQCDIEMYNHARGINNMPSKIKSVAHMQNHNYSQ